jgi:TPR repeat protein
MERRETGRKQQFGRRPDAVNDLLTTFLQLAPIGPANRGSVHRGYKTMSANWITPVEFTPADDVATNMLVASCLAAAAAGDVSAYFDLGVAYSTGSHGAPCDLVEAHKWFNLAAVGGYEDAAQCRADVADEMTAREIAEAQRRAREWLAAGARRAA